MLRKIIFIIFILVSLIFSIETYIMNESVILDYEFIRDFHLFYFLLFTCYFIFFTFLFFKFKPKDTRVLIVSVIMLLICSPSIVGEHLYTPDVDRVNYFHGEKVYSSMHGIRFSNYLNNGSKLIEYCFDGSFKKKYLYSNVFIIQCFSFIINTMVGATLMIHLLRSKFK